MEKNRSIHGLSLCVLKMLKIMKLTVFLMLVSFVGVFASETYSQTTKLSLKVEKISLEEFLIRIEDQSEFRFFYTGNIDIDKRVSGEFKNKNIIEILDDIKEEAGIHYEVMGKQIILSPENMNAKVKSIQQQKSVSGRVTDEKGEPLPGVTVLFKGTTNGTVTSFNGEYTLTDVTEGTVLQFSFVGMTMQEVVVGAQVSINVVMVANAIDIDEVVAVGYGVIKKSDLTGAVSAIKEDEFNAGVNGSIEQLVAGKVAGVQISQYSAEPGGGISVRVRGVTSVNAGNDPLYVIDGLPVDNSSMFSGGGAASVGRNQARNPLNSLNTNDIESIEILKDASATAIYGARGANGVILITTKKGKQGQTTINYNINLGVQSVKDRYDLLTSQEYMKVINELSVAEGKGTIFSPSDMASIAGTDWQDQIFRTALIQEHNLSATAGDDNTTFFASFNYFNQEGVIKNTGIEKYIGRINLEQKIGEKTQIGINLNTSLINDNNSIDNSGDNEAGGPLYAALLYDPTEPVYDENGELTISSNLTVQNPIRLVKGISSKNVTNRTFGTAYIEYNVSDNLQAKLNFGTDRATSRRDIYNSRLTFHGSGTGGLANIATLERSNVLLEYTMTYTKPIGQNNNLTVLGGTTYQSFSSRHFVGDISGFPADDLLTNNFSLGNTDNDMLYSGRSENKLLSYLARVNYSIANKYLLTASFRADGSSRFGKNNQYGYFPSFAGAWKLSEEDFIPDLFYNLKLRASWGQIGNESIGNYEFLTTLSPGDSYAVVNNSIVRGIEPSRVANPDLKWETTEQTDIGLDVAFFDGRISFTGDYFIKYTKDMLYNLPMPQSTGFGSRRANIGKMKNNGIEFLLNTINIKTNRLEWSSSLNFTSIKNRVESLGGLNDVVGRYSIIREGEPLNAYYGYHVLGLFQEGDDIAGSAQPDALPGHPKFEDVNDDKKIDTKDLQIIGKPYADFIFGLQNSISYDRFQLDIFIQGQYGADLINQNLVESLYPKNFRRNRITTTALDRWTPENTNAKWPSGVFSDDYGGNRTTNSLTVQDASFIRLKNVQLSYDIPVSRIKFMSSAKVFITGQNLLTISNYIGSDPEANANGGGSARIDISGYPPAQTWSFGARFSF
ncbi:SusC/RagA family TonB-linked outer membrane protein [Maribellus luteus]|uniref:SusC/RagA family TonB-linked outer membrane protein n=2 Tax=Maribellus luteus TaxID=2305463 RepID=A0A399T2B0_9BACT|nr:SusC/RagA family TonB-linked outer membrane protein [Maribellus luteus]